MNEVLLPQVSVEIPPEGLSIGQVSEATGIGVEALRYYEREGLLLDPAPRDSSGRRRYQEGDLAWIAGLVMLRETGMSIADIRVMADLSRREGTEAERLDVLTRHRERVIADLRRTERHLAAIEKKIAYYRRVNAVKNVNLGRQGLQVSPQGLGAMGMSAFYGTRDETEAVATLNRAVDLGVTHIDTAEAYGPYENEKLIARALGARRDEITIATKFARDFDNGAVMDGGPDHVRRAADRSLRHLGVDVIDLYYLHRVDPAVPIEETVGAMAELVTAGKVRYLGLSEAGPATIRRAHAVHPITAVQSELSLFAQDLLVNGVKETLDELGIGLVAFSPIGRGLLTGAIRSTDDLDPDDARRGLPWFAPETIEASRPLVDRIGARRRGPRRDPGADRPRLGRRAGRGRHPRHEAAPLPGGERRGDGDRPHRGGARRLAEAVRPARSRAPGTPRGPGHEQPVARGSSGTLGPILRTGVRLA